MEKEQLKKIQFKIVDLLSGCTYGEALLSLDAIEKAIIITANKNKFNKQK